ncbi:MAG TPA: anthranilate synthase component I family protein [Sedimentisphaerales bacterium]|nr:anthranilate synthase component I family protein [Sedimentisphaerales bacterium]HRS10646.1 anthranilate synthase component I family protein [Sedimentisphaerales bacterium]HRV47351.1 anthranilate synthase component I family protein [Sedimentisphaerales bacterium]
MASILGANAAVADGPRFSYWAAEPREVFEITQGSAGLLERIETALAKYQIAGKPADLPDGLFCGGWIGYLSYELGRYIERLPQRAVDDLALPLIRLCFYDRFLTYDHREEVFRIIALEWPDDTESPESKIEAVQRILGEATRRAVIRPPAGNIENLDLLQVRSNTGKARYLQAIEQIKQYIRDGEVYQVNLSHRFERPFAGRPIDLFHWQNHYNPSPYAAYIEAGDFQIVSASPEMFIRIQDGWIETKPIKGTRPRLGGSDPHSMAANRRRLEELQTSEKEQAELNMIVDLERNDVARICRPGTRRVLQPRTIEAYPTVFHAVATVGGQLRAGIRFSEILKAMFPGGSVTGAPKIRAMEIIDEFEPTTRGVYTGSIGFIGLDGTVCLNIAIRTVIIAAHKAFIQTGGGIVADSDPKAEWNETIAKARALLAGIDAVQKP